MYNKIKCIMLLEATQLACKENRLLLIIKN